MDESEQIRKEILVDVAHQVPSTWEDKWNAWRYLAMLGNPKTHIRNIVGNAIFVPVVRLKDTIGTGLEHFFVEKGDRTKSIFTTKAERDYAKNDFEKIKDIITGNGKYNPNSIIKDNMIIYKNKVAEKIRTFNLNMLEKEDGIFLKSAYDRALSMYMHSNGYTADFLNSGTKEANAMLERGRTYAIGYAQNATYRDASSLANALNKFKNKNALTKVVGEGMLPFTKHLLILLKEVLSIRLSD